MLKTLENTCKRIVNVVVSVFNELHAILVPKTINNDLLETDLSFLYGKKCLEKTQSPSETSERNLMVKIQGRPLVKIIHGE